MADGSTSIAQRQAPGHVHARINARESELGIAWAEIKWRNETVAA
jgi:hypothetical protein